MFEIKIKELDGRQCSRPESFQAYLKRTGQKAKKKTPELISIDDRQNLDTSLKTAKFMVFRLGQSKEETGTSFSLAKCQTDWSDYFIDDECFCRSEPKFFVPEVGFDKLFIFQLLPELSESALMNLAFGCGLMGTALNLDSQDSVPTPLSGSFSPTFQFRAFPGAEIWTHRKGQVEIDGAILGKRHGNQVLFVIEAKNDRTTTLAKHKLLYPVLGLLEAIPLTYRLSRFICA